VRRSDGGFGLVRALALERRPQRMYNLTVAQAHTFFVGQGRWLVHNQCAPYQVGRYNDLSARSVGDDLAIHHVPQKHPAGQVISGYDLRRAPSIALPEAEHRRIPTARGLYTGTPRNLLARDVRDLRRYTNAPNSAIRELLSLVRRTYPGVLSK
jgi:hypothetical protein